MGVLFAATAGTSTIASIWVLAGLPKVAARRDAMTTRLRVNRVLLGVLMTGVVGGLITGVYETCWTLLLDLRGAQTWQVGLSWTLFATPFAVFSPVAGRMADRFNRATLSFWALLSSVGFAATYPFLHSIALLIGLGSIESIGVAIAYPAAQSLLAQSVPEEALGRAQGLSNAIQTASIAASAGVSGALFGVAPWIPFVGAAVAAAILIGLLPVVWRMRTPELTGQPVAPADAADPAEPALSHIV
jgi:DHA1 family multidrug resistance protein-like MFS transporter